MTGDQTDVRPTPAAPREPLPEIEIRVVTDPTELGLFTKLERTIWGEGDAVSVNMLVATLVEGGGALGAFDGERLVGSVFGFAARESGVLHSHYLAVLPEFRRAGLGQRLKAAQADWARDEGFWLMRWTFDPLQLPNAHLNLNRLGTLGVSYHQNHYGEMGGINGGLPSDRLTVAWWLLGDRPQLGPEEVTVQVPETDAEQIAAGAESAYAARHAVRREMAPLLAQGWVVSGVEVSARSYTLRKPARAS